MTIPLTIQVFYSCHLCSLTRIPLDVPAREDEDVLTWMNSTVRLIGADHFRRSPRCQATSLQDLMIPVTPSTSKIGGSSQQ